MQSDLKDLKKKEMAKGEMNTDWSWSKPRNEKPFNVIERC